jgi:hypothetical protein
MKLAARFLAALAVLAFATPALPCGERAAKTVTASTEKPAASGAVAKSTEKKAKNVTKPAAETKPVKATN